MQRCTEQQKKNAPISDKESVLAYMAYKVSCSMLELKICSKIPVKSAKRAVQKLK